MKNFHYTASSAFAEKYKAIFFIFFFQDEEDATTTALATPIVGLGDDEEFRDGNGGEQDIIIDPDTQGEFPNKK